MGQAVKYHQKKNKKKLPVPFTAVHLQWKSMGQIIQEGLKAKCGAHIFLKALNSSVKITVI